jgi:hypothetical protein
MWISTKTLSKSDARAAYIPAKKRSLVSTNSGGGLVSSTTIYFYRTYYTCRLRSNIAPKPQLSRKIPSIHHYQNNKNYNTSYKNPAKIFLQGQQKPSGCGTLPGTQSTYIAGKKYLTRKNPARKRPIHWTLSIFYVIHGCDLRLTTPHHKKDSET